MKTKEELNKLKDEFEVLYKKLAELSEDELKEVAGGVTLDMNGKNSNNVAIYPGITAFP